jgi:hypothetical protein
MARLPHVATTQKPGCAVATGRRGFFALPTPEAGSKIKIYAIK